MPPPNSAKLLAPRAGDEITILQNGTIPVHSRYAVQGMPALRCYVGAYADAPAYISGSDFHEGPVTFGAPYAAPPNDVHLNQTVKVAIDGVDQPGPQQITVRVLPPATVVYQTATARSAPAAPAPLPAVGVPIRYIIYGNAETNVAYISVALSAWPDADAQKTPIGGVLTIPLADRSWAVEVLVPNAANTAYLARVIRFDREDNIVRKNTVVLK